MFSGSKDNLINEKEFQMISLFDKIGGAAAVDTAVDTFYRKVLADDLISAYFDDVDMGGQIAKQKSYLTLAFGGPNNFSGTDMREAHQDMPITEELFGAVAGHLSSTLVELQVATELINEVMTIAGSTHDDIVTA